MTVRIKDAGNPTVRFNLAQTSIPYGTKLPLNAAAQPSECGGPAEIRYSASEGSVVGNSFDSSTVGFDRSNRLKQQTKLVPLTATATDRKGGTGVAGAEVTVVLSPEAHRLDDVVFPANSARVTTVASGCCLNNSPRCCATIRAQPLFSSVTATSAREAPRRPGWIAFAL